MSREIDIRTNFAREVLLRKLEAEVRADRRPPHVLDIIAVVHAAIVVAQRPRINFKPWRMQ